MLSNIGVVNQCCLNSGPASEKSRLRWHVICNELDHIITGRWVCLKQWAHYHFIASTVLVSLTYIDDLLCTNLCRIQDLKKGVRPRFWGLAPNIFGVIFCHFRGLFKVFGENKTSLPLDPPLQMTYLITIITRQPSRCALQLLFGRRMSPRMVISLSPISLVMWG